MTSLLTLRYVEASWMKLTRATDKPGNDGFVIEYTSNQMYLCVMTEEGGKKGPKDIPLTQKNFFRLCTGSLGSSNFSVAAFRYLHVEEGRPQASRVR